jgi:hypothetical protein
MGKMDLRPVSIALPVHIVSPSFLHGSHGDITIADANNMILLELINGTLESAEFVVRSLNAKPD